MRRFKQLASLLVLTALVVLTRGDILAAAEARGGEARGGITEISVEHTVCFGTCPVYKVILRADHSATFIGVKFTDRTGTYKADVGGVWEHLVRAVQRAGFFGLRDRYAAPMTDMPSVITSVVRGGRRKTVVNYGDAGPQPLWELQALIDGAVAQAKWQKVSASTAYPAAH